MVKIGELYMHFKGGIYKVVGFVRDCDTLKEKVVYEQLYDKEDFKRGDRWVRDLDVFEGYKEMPTGSKVKRFERIGQLVEESGKVKVKVKKLSEDAIAPSYAHTGDAGMDMYSIDECIIKPGERKLIHTGISMELPEGYFASLRGKSGLAYKKGIDVLAGVIEYTYRGEYGVVALNTGNESLEVKKGDKVAQVLIQPIATANVEEAEELSDTTRGAGGFGSTGSR